MLVERNVQLISSDVYEVVIFPGMLYNIIIPSSLGNEVTTSPNRIGEHGLLFLEFRRFFANLDSWKCFPTQLENDKIVHTSIIDVAQKIFRRHFEIKFY